MGVIRGKIGTRRRSARPPPPLHGKATINKDYIYFKKKKIISKNVSSYKHFKKSCSEKKTNYIYIYIYTERMEVFHYQSFVSFSLAMIGMTACVCLCYNTLEMKQHLQIQPIKWGFHRGSGGWSRCGRRQCRSARWMKRGEFSGSSGGRFRRSKSRSVGG